MDIHQNGGRLNRCSRAPTTTALSSGSTLVRVVQSRCSILTRSPSHGSVQQACDRFRRMLPNYGSLTIFCSASRIRISYSLVVESGCVGEMGTVPNFIVWLTVKAFQVVDCFRIGLEETVEKLRPFFRRDARSPHPSGWELS